MDDHFHIDVYLFPKDKTKIEQPIYMADLLWRRGVISADIPFASNSDGVAALPESK